MPTVIEPASRTTLIQSVAEQFLSLIQEGHFRPGDRLPAEKELSEQLQVGRSTVREALRTLASLGIIDRRPGHGTFVKEMDIRDVLRPELLVLTMDKAISERLLEARQIIEPGIASLAAERATEEDLAALSDVLVRSEQAIKAGQPMYTLSPEFHRTMALAAHNDVLLMFMDSIQSLLIERGCVMERQPDYLKWELESHRGIYELIARRDVAGVRVAVAKHIEESGAALFKAMS